MSAATLLNDESGLAKIMAHVGEVPVLPHVVFKVMEISASAESPGAELESAIVIDPGFSSKLISLANSAYYSLPKKVSSVSEAIMFLGFKAIRQLAMTVGVFDMFIGKNDRDSLRRRRWWRHSVDTAVCCRWIARKTNALPPDDAYTCGLLHYIGKTLLDRFGEGSYDKVELLMEHGATDLQAERAVYKCNHVEVAQAAGAQWGFPAELLAGLGYRSESPGEFEGHSACVAVASRLAQMALQGQDCDQEASPSPDWALSKLGFSSGDAQDLVAVAAQMIAEAASIQL